MKRPALDDRGLALMERRIALFLRRGLTADKADRLVDRLVDRDYDLDDRGMCIECAHVRRAYRCDVGAGGIRGRLHRCGRFQPEVS